MTAWLSAAWARIFECRQCHGTGVIMSPDCDCGGGPWTGHEPYCGTYRCPRRCPMAKSYYEAVAVWVRYWPPQGESWKRGTA